MIEIENLTEWQIDEFLKETKKQTFIATMNGYRRELKKAHIIGGIALGVVIFCVIYTIIALLTGVGNVIFTIIISMLPFGILPFGIPAYIGTIKGIKEGRDQYIRIVSKWKLTYEKYVELLNVFEDLKKEKRGDNNG